MLGKSIAIFAKLLVGGVLVVWLLSRVNTAALTQVLVTADALGTVPHYFALGGEPLGVHPLLRLAPPKQLARLDPEHVLCGHGAGVHERATEALRGALANSRRRLPRLALELPRALWRR